MRTDIAIDDTMKAEALAATGLSSKREAMAAERFRRGGFGRHRLSSRLALSTGAATSTTSGIIRSGAEGATDCPIGTWYIQQAIHCYRAIENARRWRGIAA